MYYKVVYACIDVFSFNKYQTSLHLFETKKVSAELSSIVFCKHRFFLKHLDTLWLSKVNVMNYICAKVIKYKMGKCFKHYLFF